MPNYSPAGTGAAHITRWMSATGNLLNALQSSGTTANRPTTFLFDGRTYFDTTLGTPIWYVSAGWVDAAGAGA